MSRLTQPKFHGVVTVADSSLIKAVKYDQSNGILDLKLTSGQAYRYRNVWSDDFTALITSKSAGKVYNDRIKRNYYGEPRKTVRLRVW